MTRVKGSRYDIVAKTNTTIERKRKLKRLILQVKFEHETPIMRFIYSKQ